MRARRAPDAFSGRAPAQPASSEPKSPSALFLPMDHRVAPGALHFALIHTEPPLQTICFQCHPHSSKRVRILLKTQNKTILLTLLFSINYTLLIHSFPAIHLLTSFYKLGTGGVPHFQSRELKCNLSFPDRHRVTSHPSVTCKASVLAGDRLLSARLSAPRDGANACRDRKKRKRRPRGKGRLLFVFTLEHVPVRRSGLGVCL
jgi:hypothetical protein